jgi:hypothetical protein
LKSKRFSTVSEQSEPFLNGQISVALTGKTARINGKPVLFAKAFGEMNNVGRTGKEK